MSDAADGQPIPTRFGNGQPFYDVRLFDGVRRRRVLAFALDVALIAILTFVAGIAVFFLGIFTLGLGWFAYLFLWQGIALVYAATTLGGPNGATPGMRAMGIEMRLRDGSRPYPLIAVAHSLLFWFSVSLLTPFVLAISLIDDRKRTLHDLLLGTVVVDTDALRRSGF